MGWGAFEIRTIAAAIVAAAAFAPQAAAVELGTVGDITWGISRADTDRSVALMREAGVKWVRANVGWSAVERDGKGVYNEGWLRELDYAIAAARAAGLEVLVPIADGVPYWASADPEKRVESGKQRWNVLYRPTSFADYADFVRFVVERYRVHGVRAYEIWNEPNHPWFWPSGPSASVYSEMLRAAYPAVKAADPGATVVLGGLAGNDHAYLDALYAAGAGASFDAVAVHPYTGAVDPAACWRDSAGKRAKEAFCGIEEVREVMTRNGDARKQVWLTEFGWSSSTAQYGVTEQQQSAYLDSALRAISSYPFVHSAFYYGFRNVHWLRDDPTKLQANYGLLRTDFSAKPAFAVFRAHATARPPAPAAPAATHAAAPQTDPVGAARSTATKRRAKPAAKVESKPPKRSSAVRRR